MMERISVFVGDGEGEEGEMTKGYKDTFGAMDMCIILMMVMMVSWVNTCEQSYPIVHFKYV